MTDAGFATTLHTVRVLLAQKSTPKVKHPKTGEMVEVVTVKPFEKDGRKFFEVTHE